MRRKDREITDPTLLKKILKKASYITIAMSMDDQPYLVSLSHGYDENRNCLYFHCANEGKKLQYLKSNSKVWGQAVLDQGYIEGKCSYRYASVHFSGKITFTDNLEEKRTAIETMIRQQDKDPEKLITELNMTRLEKTTSIGRIDIDQMIGKKHEDAEI
jgi:nitroimidazol reductase NimA-like FMN-containing flavoprotein (pyridoxamine 5'-phosphate oxidase superfamily)